MLQKLQRRGINVGQIVTGPSGQSVHYKIDFFFVLFFLEKLTENCVFVKAIKCVTAGTSPANGLKKIMFSCFSVAQI